MILDLKVEQQDDESRNVKKGHENVIWLGIGGGVVADSPEKTKQKSVAGAMSSMIQVNASGMISQGMKAQGEKEYFEKFVKKWREFKKAGGLRGSAWFGVGGWRL